MKAIIIAENSESAASLVSAAHHMHADEIIQISLGERPETSSAPLVAVLELDEGFAYEDAFESIAAFCEAEKPALVLSEPTRRLRIIAGRLAARAGVSALCNVIGINEDAISTMYFGGLATKKVRSTAPVTFLYVNPSTFEPAEPVASRFVGVAWQAPPCALKVLEREELSAAQVDLSSSDVVIGCGRGFAERSELELVDSLSARLNAGVGCTRPLTEVVDWFPKEAYIGVSGQVASPKVYFALGLSGQMQHMVGVSGAGQIIAINKDKDAPIFKQCDLGIVGDLKQVLPALAAALES